MDISEMAKKLGLSLPESKHLIRRAAELRRLADAQFHSSIIGVGEICKAVICLEIAADGMEVMIDRHAAIKLCGLSEKAYIRSFNSMQNAIGIKNKVDIRELVIQFGCVRIIPFVIKGLSLYKDRFLASLPPSRRAITDFTRPVFTGVAFYLCGKRHKLKVDKIKLLELCGASESEFSSISTSMMDLCFDVFGTSREKKDTKAMKGNQGILYASPEKRSKNGNCSSSDEEPSAHKKHKRVEKRACEDSESSFLESNKHTKATTVPRKRTRQAWPDFSKKVPETQDEAT